MSYQSTNSTIWFSDPIYFLAAIYGNEELGYFSMALTLFNIPVQLFSNAISPVFLQKAHELNLKGPLNLRNLLLS